MEGMPFTTTFDARMRILVPVCRKIHPVSGGLMSAMLDN
jgi:hypothetical protein